MKRILTLAVVAAAMTVNLGAQSNDIMKIRLESPKEVTEKSETVVESEDRDEVIVASTMHELAQVAEEQVRKRSGSTSRTKSSSTSHKTQTIISKNVAPVRVEDLAVNELFGDRYKRTAGCQLTVIDNETGKYRRLDVRNNADLAAKIKNLVERDKSKASDVVQNYDENSDRIVMSFPGGATVGFTYYINKEACEIFFNYNDGY